MRRHVHHKLPREEDAYGTMVPRFDFAEAGWWQVRGQVSDIESNLEKLKKINHQGIWGDLEVEFAEKTIDLEDCKVVIGFITGEKKDAPAVDFDSFA